jgi:ABC-type antimicrobial peptide transport system permease subunit
VRALDEDLPLYGVETLSQHIRLSLLPVRAGSVALAVLGSLALLLTTIGTYGTMMSFVAARRREVGIRMALGAPPIGVRRRVMRQGLVLVVVGIVIGVLLAVILSRAASSLLYGVDGVEVPMIAGVSLLVLAVGSVAAWLPARAATRVDPSAVLRVE